MGSAMTGTGIKTETAHITGIAGDDFGQVHYPFDYGCVEMVEINGVLYIATSHQGYVDDSRVRPSGTSGGCCKAEKDDGEIIKNDLWHSRPSM